MTKHINVVKLSPERIPALAQEMERERATVEASKEEAVKVAFLETLKHAQNLAEVSKVTEKNLRPLNLDHDDVGYGIYNILDTAIESISAPRVFALSPEESAYLADAKSLQAELYPPDGPEAIFKLGYVAEWNAVEKLLSNAQRKENQERAARLGLTVMIGRLSRIHVLMGKAIGIQSETATPLQSNIALFEKALERLIARTYAVYDEETAEHQKWRATLLGPYDRQLEVYREEQRRKRRAAADEKKSEPKLDPIDKETN
jgi:hypothetical protein